MKSIYILILLCGLTTSNLFSQTGSIAGTVIDEADKTPVEFATITLFKSADSTLVSGTVTNDLGQFILDVLPHGDYYVRINFMGYHPKFISSITIGAQNLIVTLTEISLSPSSALNTIEVTTSQNVFEMKIDKKIFNADENLTSKGGTGLDLLRQIPTITVDQNDVILLRGDANVTVLIDNRPTAMPANQYLKQIPSSAIERVEIITNPSAKYDPEGMSGIINIVMKKSKSTGFNGSVTASFGYGVLPKTNNSVALNYRTKKLNISANYSYYYGRTWFGGSLDRNVLVNDTTWDRLRSEDLGGRINTYSDVQVGIDYFINDNNTVYATANGGFGYNIGNRLITYNNVGNNEELLYYSQRNGDIEAPSRNYTYTAGWQRTFKNPEHTLFLDFNYSNSSFVGDEKLWHKYYDADAIQYNTLYQNTLDNTFHQTLLAKLDYTLPINDSTILEAGFHFTQRLADNEFYSESALANQIYTADTLLNNQFIYTQNTLAPYITFAKQIKQFGIKIGLRAEPTLTAARLVNSSEEFINNYFQIFPSTHFSYKFKNYSEILFSYSRRINRPELDQLNPFTNYSDPLVLENGNPFLKPEVIHVNEITYMKYWKKFNINATAYYRLINDLIRRQLLFNGIYSVVTNSNLGKSNLSGGDLILTYMPIKGMRLISSTSVWNTSTKDPEVTNGSYQNFTGMYTSLSASYRIKGGWMAQLWASYSPSAKVIQGRILQNYGGGIGIQKSILKDKGSINLNVYDVLKSRWFAFESSDLGNYNMTSIRRWESRSAYISFTYNFGKVTESKERKRNNSSDIGDDLDVPISQ